MIGYMDPIKWDNPHHMAVSHNIIEQVRCQGTDWFRHLSAYWKVIDYPKALVLVF